MGEVMRTSQKENVVIFRNAAKTIPVPPDTRMISDCAKVYEKDGLVQ
ncbi:MAG TPA: hypothetical protein VNE41_10120 [Chitinophagaceae bacterium]|nr:hypothetical protein [Chitinophagaceae bacterium]